MPANKNELKWKATVKAYPAVSDLQAISGFVRIQDIDTDVGAPTYDQDIYTVPAGQIFIQQNLVVNCQQADPTNVGFRLRKGANVYEYYSAPYGFAYELHGYVTEVMYDEAEIVRIRWTGTLATTDVVAVLFGYLINKY